MLQTLKEALSSTLVKASLVVIVLGLGSVSAYIAKQHYEKAVKDDAKAWALHQAADSINKLRDSLAVVIKADKARADSMLTIIRPKVVEHGTKLIDQLKKADSAVKIASDISVVTHSNGKVDTLVTIPVVLLNEVLGTADSLARAYAELEVTDQAIIDALKITQADLESLVLKDVAVINLQKKEIETKDDEIKHLKKARTVDKIAHGAIIVGVVVLSLFFHR